VETSLEVIGRFGWDGPVGVGFPGVIKGGVVHTAANVAKELIEGTVMMLTLGTGIGTALFTQGKLMANTEFGHLLIRNREAELRTSDRIRKQEELSWKQWAKRLNEYFATMEALFWPDLIIVGGGVSKKAHKFVPKLKTRAEIVPAKMLNIAGIAGAALAPEVLPRSAPRVATPG
jgi:polyphosphate glucokinase